MPEEDAHKLEENASGLYKLLEKFAARVKQMFSNTSKSKNGDQSPVDSKDRDSTSNKDMPPVDSIRPHP